MEPQYNDQQLKPMASLQSLFTGDVIDTRTPKQKLIDRASEVMDKPKRVIAIRISHLSQMDADAFLKDCEEADNFGAFFNWSLNPKNIRQRHTTA